MEHKLKTQMIYKLRRKSDGKWFVSCAYASWTNRWWEATIWKSETLLKRDIEILAEGQGIDQYYPQMENFRRVWQDIKIIKIKCSEEVREEINLKDVISNKVLAKLL